MMLGSSGYSKCISNVLYRMQNIFNLEFDADGIV